MRWFLLASLLLTTPGQAQWVPFTEAVLTKQTQIKEGPEEGANSLGQLPEFTIVKVLDQTQGAFILVSVELANKRIVEGWVKREALEKPATYSPSKKILVPQDEAALLMRDQTFVVGLHIGANLSFIETDTSDRLYVGTGFIGGGYLGVFLHKHVPIRLQVDYIRLTGTPDAGDDLGLHLLDIGIIPSYLMDSFELFGGISYNVGLGIGIVPQGATIHVASDLSSTWAQIGLGYRVRFGDVPSLALRLKYMTSFQRSPFIYNVFAVTTALEFTP